jgi:hypothetical protein
MSEDPFAGYRPLLAAAKAGAVDALEFSHAALLREQVANSEAEPDWPALCCLLAADAVSGETGDALPAATAIALLGEMVRTFSAIASEDEAGLEGKWGMPRALNAGDAFYNLAQAMLLQGARNLDQERQFLLSTHLDRACRAFAEWLFERSPGNKRSLVAAALTLGALAADADEATAAQACEFTLGPDNRPTTGLSPGARAKLAAARPYLRNVGIL